MGGSALDMTEGMTRNPEEVLGQFRGVVKAMSPEKGFGFITCPDLKAQGYQADVFVHRQHFKNYMAGTEVSFTAYLHNGRPQAKDLEGISNQGADAGTDGACVAAGTTVSGNPKDTVLGTYCGQIKSFNAEKNFGFIGCPELADGGGDAYLHGKHIGNFSVGDQVLFTAFLFKGRLQCRDLQDPFADVQ